MAGPIAGSGSEKEDRLDVWQCFVLLLRRHFFEPSERLVLTLGESNTDLKQIAKVFDLVQGTNVDLETVRLFSLGCSKRPSSKAAGHLPRKATGLSAACRLVMFPPFVLAGRYRQKGRWPGRLRLRASGEHSIIPGPESIDLECATREHVSLPGHIAPAHSVRPCNSPSAGRCRRDSDPHRHHQSARPPARTWTHVPRARERPPARDYKDVATR